MTPAGLAAPASPRGRINPGPPPSRGPTRDSQEAWREAHPSEQSLARPRVGGLCPQDWLLQALPSPPAPWGAPLGSLLVTPDSGLQTHQLAGEPPAALPLGVRWGPSPRDRCVLLALLTGGRESKLSSLCGAHNEENSPPELKVAWQQLQAFLESRGRGALHETSTDWGSGNFITYHHSLTQVAGSTSHGFVVCGRGERLLVWSDPSP